MSWDGSYFLFEILDSQTPFVPRGRWIHFPLQWLFLLTNRFTSDLTILRTTFGLIYVAIPLVALMMSWLLLRHKRQQLFVWAAFGIGVGTLPGQFFFTTESTMAIQLFWPLLLGILGGIRKPQVLILMVLAIAVFFAHPVAIALFAVGAGLTFVVGWGSRDERRLMWVSGSAFSALAVLKFAVF